MAQVSPSSITLAQYAPTKTTTACPKEAAVSLPSNPHNAQMPSNPRFSSGAKIGVGISIPIVFLALGAALILYLRARKKKRHLSEHDRNAQWTKKELAAEEIDREAKGYGPHMAASTRRTELEAIGVVRELPADICEVFEAPGDVPILPELLYTSFETDFLSRFSELAG